MSVSGSDRPVVIPLVGGGEKELASWLAPRLEAKEVLADERELESWEAFAEIRHNVEEGETTVVHGSLLKRPGVLESLCAAVLDAGGICVPFYIDAAPANARGVNSEKRAASLPYAGAKGAGYDDPEYQTAYFSEGLPTVIGVRLDGSRPVEETGSQLLRLFY